MGILSGMDIERIQSDININFYIQDIIANKASGYVMPDDVLFAKVFSQKEVYRSISVMSALATSIGNITVSDASREFFRQKAIEYVDVWGGMRQIVPYMTRIFAGIGASLYSVKNKIPIDWAKPTASNTHMFNPVPLFLYLSGVISKTQWFRYKQGFEGANPDPLLNLIISSLWTKYEVGDNNYTVINTVGTGDDISEITLLCTNAFATGMSSGVALELGCDYRKITWGKDSEMRRLSNNYFDSHFSNKNLVKQMVPKYREYLTPTGGPSTLNSFIYAMDTEPSLIYQPSITEFWATKVSSAVPSVPQTKFNYSSTVTNEALSIRALPNSSTAQIYALRDCDWGGGGTVQTRALVNTNGQIMLGVSGSAYVPVLFDMQLPMWCM